MWIYKGIYIFPHDSNSSGLRWIARDTSSIPSAPPVLRADTKQGMREMITHYLAAGS